MTYDIGGAKYHAFDKRGFEGLCKHIIKAMRISISRPNLPGLKQSMTPNQT